MTQRAVILIADGDPMWVQSMIRLLESEGYQVLSARTGVDALYQTRMRRPDLLLLNPDLPQLSGWEVCRRVKNMPGSDRTKVVMLTVRADTAYRTGADGYLIKAGAAEHILPAIRVFRHPVQGILSEFLHRRALAA
jgi:DNA-binding response OmpR family regulator